MGDVTKIQWCHKTFNPWTGCTIVSTACKNCYAARQSARRKIVWNTGNLAFAAESTWKKPLTWDRKAKREGVRYRIFCASFADVFDANAPQEWRARLWNLIASTPSLDWLVLTKRPQNFKSMLPSSLPFNLWLGVTSESQKWADRRVPLLIQTEAKVKFISAEPLIEAIDFSSYIGDLSWIIVGGETGKLSDLRQFDWHWARSIREQCQEAGISFFMKQLGQKHNVLGSQSRAGDALCEMPEPIAIREFPCSPIFGSLND
jgi:protein gp37